MGFRGTPSTGEDYNVVVFEYKFFNIMYNLLPRMVEAILRQRFPSHADDPLCATATICLLADDVCDIRELIAVICSSNSVTEKDTREALYRIAALFLHMERHNRLPYRLRYQIHHALYLSEKTQESGINFTAEQKRIIGYPLDPTKNGVLRVLAYAGTGKTTVLKHLALKNPSLRFLLVAFNRSTQSHAAARFPSNVEARTAHSLAKSWCEMNGYQGRLLFGRSTYLYEVLGYLGTERAALGKGSGNVYMRAALTLEALRKFAHSTRPHVTLEDVPDVWISNDKNSASFEPVSPVQALDLDLRNKGLVKPEVRMAALKDAEILWDQGIADRKSKFKIEGTFYIKLCQLSNPDLHNLGKKGPFDVLLIDEGQDMNPAMLDVCLRQKGLKVIVGDPNQQIYEWNGAIDGLEHVGNYCQVIDTLHLTESFRFGTEIAFVATEVMNCLIMHREASQRPQLLLSSDQVQDKLSYRGNPEVSPKKKMAILSRSNERMWSEIFALVCEPILSGQVQQLKIIIKMPGNRLYDYLNELCDLSLLKQKEKEKISLGSRYKKKASFEEYKSQQELENNMQELMKCSIVQKHATKMASYCDIIRESVVHYDGGGEWPNVDYIFSTVHQFKGLEYPTVMLLDDFITPEPYLSGSDIPAEEKRILYVAVTRAQSELILNDTLVTLLYGNGRMNFERVVAVNDNMIGQTCAHPICGRPLTEDQPIAVVYNLLAEHYFCSKCSSCPYKNSLQAFTCGAHRIKSVPMVNVWARLRQSMIGQEVTAANHEQLMEFYKENPLTILPKSLPKSRFVRATSEEESVFDDGNEDFLMAVANLVP